MPRGLRIASLSDDDDFWKMHRLLWRGFNHEGEPPPDARSDRELMQSGPGFRKDLNVVIVAPDGGFVFLPVLRLPADAPPLGLATTLVT